ncbi:MAG: diaminopimelate decarboxylase [Propionibacteriaceae bacterium]|nr:diaminopimelate decarboxylase [Propionibacteriaceae bacterium]
METRTFANPAAPQWLEVPENLCALDAVLWPQGTQRSADGEITISGQSVTELVSAFGSPLYVIDEQDFRARARQFKNEFPTWGVSYASKAFLCRAVARWVKEEGLGLDVCSGNELAVALTAGFPPEKIGFHGNNKSVEELRYAIKTGVGRIIVDSFEEIERIDSLAEDTPVNVLVRVTTGIQAHTHEYISTSHEDQKFGFSIASGQAMKALLACHEKPTINLKGIHSHIGSQIFGTEAFDKAARGLIVLAWTYRSETGSELEEINLGGGYGIAYTNQDTPTPASDLHRDITKAINQARALYDLSPVKLSIEPGRAICGTPGVALYTVGTIKHLNLGNSKERTYVAVDGGMSDNIRTALYGAQYTAQLANRVSDAPPMLSRVVGKHCESGDILVHDVYLPADLRVGDILAVPGSGAYARPLSSNYNYAARPAVVAVNQDGARVIVRRETLTDLMALDVDTTR